jgi:hypothetical protein
MAVAAIALGSPIALLPTVSPTWGAVLVAGRAALRIGSRLAIGSGGRCGAAFGLRGTAVIAAVAVMALAVALVAIAALSAAIGTAGTPDLDEGRLGGSFDRCLRL